MTKITIHRALAELKLIDSKIEKQINELEKEKERKILAINSEILQSPFYLCDLIPFVCKRHNDMIVYHCNCISVTLVFLCAYFIGFGNFTVSSGMLVLNPVQQRRTEIKIKIFVIIYSFNDIVVYVHYHSFAVGFIAFLQDPFVPVMKRCCGGLRFDLICPSIFTRRLIKMTVQAEE